MIILSAHAKSFTIYLIMIIVIKLISSLTQNEVFRNYLKVCDIIYRLLAMIKTSCLKL